MFYRFAGTIILTIITSGWQINAIRHSEKKWYNGESQMRVLRKATDEDYEKMEVIP